MAMRVIMNHLSLKLSDITMERSEEHRLYTSISGGMNCKDVTIIRISEHDFNMASFA